jgi:hypothetical protein
MRPLWCLCRCHWMPAHERWICLLDYVWNRIHVAWTWQCWSFKTFRCQCRQITRVLQNWIVKLEPSNFNVNFKTKRRTNSNSEKYRQCTTYGNAWSFLIILSWEIPPQLALCVSTRLQTEEHLVCRCFWLGYICYILRGRQWVNSWSCSQKSTLKMQLRRFLLHHPMGSQSHMD